MHMMWITLYKNIPNTRKNLCLYKIENEQNISFRKQISKHTDIKSRTFPSIEHRDKYELDFSHKKYRTENSAQKYRNLHDKKDGKKSDIPPVTRNFHHKISY